MNESYAAILDTILRHNRIIIHRHSNPDGDAIGSQMGLYHWIHAHFPDKEVYRVGDPAGRYSFIDGAVMDTIPDECYDGALAVLLDTAAPKLISDGRYTLAARTVRFDHHLFVDSFCDLECVDSSFESCCGLLTDFILQSGYPLTPECAEPLFVGMTTDSGRFRYDSTTPRTLRLAAELLSNGLDLNRIYRSLYSENLDKLKRRAWFTDKIQMAGDRVAYIYTTAGQLDELGMEANAVSRGMVGIMNDIEGIDVWVNFTENHSDEEHCVLCELRSSVYNINPVAVQYGGGGHQKASGATVPDRETAMKMVEDLRRLSRGEYQT